MARVAINGMGRIGRAALKILLDTPGFELVAVNDIAELDNIAYLLKYDTVYGPYNKAVTSNEGKLVIDGHEIKYLSERDPANLPWGDMNVDLVFESTGIFTKHADAHKHIDAGATYVVISGPSSSVEVPTIVYGVNNLVEDTSIVSTASCTTNNISPVMEIMHRHFGVAKAILMTIHAYTATQELVDAPGGKKDMRRGRAAAANIVPASTGAAIATTKALPEHKGNFDGTSLRVPVPVGSISDTTLVLNRTTTVEEINQVFRDEAATARYKDVIRVNEDEIVSSDIVGDAHAAIIDLTQTMVVAGDLVKVLSWYDNEWGYTNQMVRQAKLLLNLA
jgi:glyceraldehyde 3-phosphate dehydrogenase